MSPRKLAAVVLAAGLAVVPTVARAQAPVVGKPAAYSPTIWRQFSAVPTVAPKPAPAAAPVPAVGGGRSVLIEFNGQKVMLPPQPGTSAAPPAEPQAKPQPTPTLPPQRTSLKVNGPAMPLPPETGTAAAPAPVILPTPAATAPTTPAPAPAAVNVAPAPTAVNAVPTPGATVVSAPALSPTACASCGPHGGHVAHDGSCWDKLCEWVSYRSSEGCGCCPTPEYKNPPLYTFFLCTGTGNAKAGGDLRGPACDDDCAGGKCGHRFKRRRHAGEACVTGDCAAVPAVAHPAGGCATGECAAPACGLRGMLPRLGLFGKSAGCGTVECTACGGAGFVASAPVPVSVHPAAAPSVLTPAGQALAATPLADLERKPGAVVVPAGLTRPTVSPAHKREFNGMIDAMSPRR